MYVFHGTWIPSESGEFENPGQFVFWIETSEASRGRRSLDINPYHLHRPAELERFFTEELPLRKLLLALLRPEVISFWLTLPTIHDGPLPSPEMARLTGELSVEHTGWRTWQMAGLALAQPLSFLKEIQFLALYETGTFELGADLKFWGQYARVLRELVLKQQYIPALKCHSAKPGRGKRQPGESIYPGWEPLASRYEQRIAEFARAMPLSCATASLTKPYKAQAALPELLDPKDLLRHFSEQTLESLVGGTVFPQTLQKKLQGTLVQQCLSSPFAASDELTVQHWRQWRTWRQGLVAQQDVSGFRLGLRLVAAEPDQPNDWALEFFVESQKDPSLKLDLADYWPMTAAKRKPYASFLGRDFEQRLLLALGHAARICPLLWEGLETDRPQGVILDMDTAFDFLKDDAWVLEDAGFKVVVPAWWTPKGRQRARIRIRSSTTKSVAKQDAGKGWFSLPSLVQYEYRLSVGGQAVSEEEWRTLVDAKTPLIHFRGQWMELDRAQMQEMLSFWQQSRAGGQEMTLSDLLRRSAEADEAAYEFSHDEALSEMLGRLRDERRLEPHETPVELRGELREYQKRGLSWLVYLESLGLNPCLADDMGLGKTIQVIALLLRERQEGHPDPTLLIAPTSVLGNWQKEIERFAPGLRTHVHHGADRWKKPEDFESGVQRQDVLITSFTLARKDAKLLQRPNWHRVVVDEAQNIKNPKSAQTRAICRLQGTHRMALTGTPIENRLMDLWSIFQFLNPGYLNTAAQFKRRYETPIEREGDGLRSGQLKRLVTPFILRRMKTDKAIIADLPDKIEQKVYCNLTPEQASLYQALVDDVQVELEAAEGIQRKGLILSTLMRLKQICNHPAQFLQDGSAFSESRSHKLARVDEMVTEALAEGDSVLLFSQFTEIGGALEGHFRARLHCPVYYLHGGTQRDRRERMIAEFQDPATPPAVFVLSLKAGGVGLTLTKANHVFHFDRWWNPAVENQATDRAFRIGQEKKVFAHKLVALGTLEERIDSMLEDKQRLADSIVGQDESWLTELDNEAFRQLIRLNRDTVLEA